MILLPAFGNWLAGRGRWHAVGIVMLGAGLWLGHPLWSLPLFLAAGAIFRMPGTRPWLHMMQTPNWYEAINRTLFILPLVILETSFNPWHAFSILLIPGIPAIYLLARKQKKVEPVALAEFLTGGLL